MLLTNDGSRVDDLKVQSALAGLLAILLWALAPALVKMQSREIPTLYFLVLRYGLSSVLFLPILRRMKWRQLQRSTTTWIGFATALALHLGFQVTALREVPVSWYVVAFSLSPVISLVFFRLRWTLPMLAGFALAITGSFIFVYTPQLALISKFGLLALTISVFAWAALTLFIKKIQSGLSDLEVTALCNVVSLLTFGTIWLAEGLPTAALRSSDLSSVTLLSLGMPAAFFLFSRALRYVPVIAIFSQFLEPFFGILSGLIFFKEAFTVLQLGGAALILVASSLILSHHSKSKVTS